LPDFPDPTGPASSPQHHHAVECLLRALVAVVETASDQAGDDAVIAEIDIDGRSYTLSRRALDASVEPVALSAREREIATMIAHGATIDMAAHDLGISRWTVRTHVRRIYMKLDVRSRGAMVARLFDAGILGPDLRPPNWADLTRRPRPA
jgi:DNA-binding CsgD family transcriptional regulator